MSKFTIAFWVEVDAEDYDEAYKQARSIRQELNDSVDFVMDAGYHDVEEQED